MSLPFILDKTKILFSQWDQTRNFLLVCFAKVYLPFKLENKPVIWGIYRRCGKPSWNIYSKPQFVFYAKRNSWDCTLRAGNIGWHSHLKLSLPCPTYTPEILVFLAPLYALALKFHCRAEEPFAKDVKLKLEGILWFQKVGVKIPVCFKN